MRGAEEQAAIFASPARSQPAHNIGGRLTVSMRPIWQLPAAITVPTAAAGRFSSRGYGTLRGFAWPPDVKSQADQQLRSRSANRLGSQ